MQTPSRSRHRNAAAHNPPPSRRRPAARWAWIGGTVAAVIAAGCAAAPEDDTTDAAVEDLEQALNGTSVFPRDAGAVGLPIEPCSTANQELIKKITWRAKQLLTGKKSLIIECLKQGMHSGPRTNEPAEVIPPPGTTGRGTSYPEWFVHRLLENISTSHMCSSGLGFRTAVASSNIPNEEIIWASGLSNSGSSPELVALVLHELGHNKGVEHFDQTASQEWGQALNHQIVSCVSQVLRGSYRPAASAGPRYSLFEEQTLAPVGIQKGKGGRVDCEDTSLGVGLYGTNVGALQDLGLMCGPVLGTDRDTRSLQDADVGPLVPTFRDRCAAGEVMVGLHGTANETLSSVGAICASEATVRAGGATARRSVTFGPTGQVKWERLCPAGMAVKQLRGRVSGERVHRLELHCQRFTNPQRIVTQSLTMTNDFTDERAHEICAGRSVLTELYITTQTDQLQRLAGGCRQVETVGGVNRVKAFGGGVYLLPGAGSSGGSNTTVQACAPDEVIVGLGTESGEGRPLGQIGAICAKPDLWQRGESLRPLPLVGSPVGTPRQRLCSPGAYLIGWDISTSDRIIALQAHCRWFTGNTNMPSAGDSIATPVPYSLRDDILLAGGKPGGVPWTTLPLAGSNGDGTWTPSNGSVGSTFGSRAATSAARLVGDFNLDGRKDLALVGGSGWTTIPVAFSTGSGNFKVTNNTHSSFTSRAGRSGVVKLVGDFDNDGASDIALLGPPNAGIKGIMIAFSRHNSSDGWFDVRTLEAQTGSTVSTAVFNDAIGTAGVKAITGDFDGNGSTDIVLVGGGPAANLPAALFKGGRLFTRSSPIGSSWGTWASSAGVSIQVGDFGGMLNQADIALTGVSGWTNIKLATALDGVFTIHDQPMTGDWGKWAALPGMRKLVGHFNDDGIMDLALVGAAGRTSIAVAFSQRDGSFRPFEFPAPEFAALAATSGASVIAGYFDNDGLTDIALTGVSAWTSIPVVFGTRYDGFRFTNKPVSSFPKSAATSGASKHLGNMDQ